MNMKKQSDINMLNIMIVAGQPAMISFVPELNAFRGRFLGLSGYCDFVADSISALKREGELSLREYLEDCKEHGIEPYVRKEKQRTFTLRYPESFGEQLEHAAAASEVSLNAFIVDALKERLSRH